MLGMGPRLRRKILVLGGSVILTIFSFQLTGFIALQGGGDGDSPEFANAALPSTAAHRGNFRTFTPVRGQGRLNRVKSQDVGGRPLSGGAGSLDSKDTRRTLQDIGAADDARGQQRSVVESPARMQGANATVGMTTRLQFESLFPSLLEEERCPLCFGTSNCDQIYAGNISFHVGHTNLSEPHAIPGSWGERRILGKRLVRREVFQRLEDVVCGDLPGVGGSGTPCEVNAAAADSWISKGSALNRVHKLHQELYKDSFITLSATTCASDDFLSRLRQLYGASRWGSDSGSTEMALLTTTLALDPEPALLKFFRNIPPLQPYFPAHLGECGRVILTEPSGTPLVRALKASWEDRVDIALKVLQMIEDFHDVSDKWLVFLLDFRFENFALTSDGQLRLVNLGSVMVIDKEQTSSAPDMHPRQNNRTGHCNEDCLNTFVKRLETEPETYCRHVPRHVEFMYMMACHSLLSDLMTTKYERFFQPLDAARREHPGGLLHDAPYDVDTKLSELLYECVFEGQPGKRMYSARILKHLLRIIRSTFPRREAPG